MKIVVLQGRFVVRLRLAFLLFVTIVFAAVLGFAAHAPKSSAQTTGYGAPQPVPDQTIQSIGSHGSSNTGLALGAGVGVAILGGGVFVGWRHHHAAEHPYD
jgi:hypothetical protein